MSTAEQLLVGKNLCEEVSVTFPEGTLFEPFDSKTSGTIYKAAPIGTLTLAIIKKKPRVLEYFLALPLGDVFTSVESSELKGT